MRYKRLAAEMMVRNITNDDLARLLGKSRSTINGRFSGKTDFSYSEVILIMDKYFMDKSVDYIFIDK